MLIVALAVGALAHGQASPDNLVFEMVPQGGPLRAPELLDAADGSTWAVMGGADWLQLPIIIVGGGATEDLHPVRMPSQKTATVSIGGN